MMSNENRVNELVRAGVIPADGEVLSTHNNLIVLSKSERTVARIGSLQEITSREDPGDIGYSHLIAAEAGSDFPVLRPLSKKPTIIGDIILSKYPLANAVDWDRRTAREILRCIQEFNASLKKVEKVVDVRELNVEEYARQRLERAADTAHYNTVIYRRVLDVLNEHHRAYPFRELTADDPALIHGDLHSGNFVELDGCLYILDLDSASRGPRLYDLASWRYRHEMGDGAPIAAVVEEARQTPSWDEEVYRALMGWKAISSMTHILRYETKTSIEGNVVKIGDTAIRAGAYLEGWS